MMPFDQNPISLLWSIDEHHLMKSPMYLTDKTVSMDLDIEALNFSVSSALIARQILHWLISNDSETI